MSQNVRLTPGHYALLFVIVVSGVTIGNLLSNYITYAISMHYFQHSVSELERQTESAVNAVRETTQQAAEAARRAAAEREEAQQRSRANDPTGRRLERACADWRESHQVNQTRATAEGVEIHCNRYERYLRTGVVR
jgi:hypothetical protein